MDFELTEDQLFIQEAAREFAQEELAPIAHKMDVERKMDEGILDSLRELGFFGMMVPEEYGGAAMDVLRCTLVIEEVSRACASTGVLLSVHNSLANEIILQLASKQLRERLMPDMAAGVKIGAFSLSESDAGSDAAGIRCKAERDGDYYILNGRKTFVTNADHADLFIVFARTDPEKRSQGLSAFAVERNTPGFEIGRTEHKMGLRASSTTEINFTDARIPAGNRILEEGDGLKVALANLEGGRIGIGAQALGIAQAAYDEALNYAKERKQFGKSLTEFQAISFKIAEMKMEIDAARLLVYRAATMRDKKIPCALEASIAKLYASEMANRVTANAVQIHGGYGYMEDYPVERYYRDARVLTLYEGTSEVQKLVMLKHILK